MTGHLKRRLCEHLFEVWSLCSLQYVPDRKKCSVSRQRDPRKRNLVTQDLHLQYVKFLIHIHDTMFHPWCVPMIYSRRTRRLGIGAPTTSSAELSGTSFKADEVTLTCRQLLSSRSPTFSLQKVSSDATKRIGHSSTRQGALPHAKWPTPHQPGQASPFRGAQLSSVSGVPRSPKVAQQRGGVERPRHGVKACFAVPAVLSSLQ